MNRTERLRELVALARRQRDLLAQGNLTGVWELQEERQRLLDGIQTLDEPSERDRELMGAFLDLDKRIRWLVSTKITDIKEEICQLRRVRGLLKTHRTTEKPSRKSLSCRA